MTPTPSTEPLLEQVLTHAQLLAQLRHDLDQPTNAITDIHVDLTTRLEESQPASPVVQRAAAWCWRNLSPADHTELMSQLQDWVAWLRGRYPLARKLPTCWTKHPEIIEEATALWVAWRAAYETTGASSPAPADWHDRWLPGFLARIEHGAFALACRNGHEDRPPNAYAILQTEQPSED